MTANYDPEKYVRGEMDISMQEGTFKGFVNWSLYITLATIFVLIFLLLVGT